MSQTQNSKQQHLYIVNCISNLKIFRSIEKKKHNHATMGVTKKVIKEGAGPTPHTGQLVHVHCTGYLANQPPKKFWSTHDSGKSFSFNCGVGKVIKGWDEGKYCL
jgi:FKBP-type peptidyl-prolyl cis-trans isomerase